MKQLLSLIIFFFAGFAFSQSESVELREYVTLRVQYGNTISGYTYELFLDIGTSGSHSLSGYVTNENEKVIIKDDRGKYEFTSDIDVLNYLAKNGWRIIQYGQIEILDQHYYTYLLERVYSKG
jgi:hypothetical protein